MYVLLYINSCFTIAVLVTYNLYVHFSIDNYIISIMSSQKWEGNVILIENMLLANKK